MRVTETSSKQSAKEIGSTRLGDVGIYAFRIRDHPGYVTYPTWVLPDNDGRKATAGTLVGIERFNLTPPREFVVYTCEPIGYTVGIILLATQHTFAVGALYVVKIEMRDLTAQSA